MQAKIVPDWKAYNGFFEGLSAAHDLITGKSHHLTLRNSLISQSLMLDLVKRQLMPRLEVRCRHALC